LCASGHCSGMCSATDEFAHDQTICTLHVTGASMIAMFWLKRISLVAL